LHVSEEAPKMQNLALEVQGTEMIDFIKRSVKEIVCFCGGVQNDKTGPGGARARNERFYKRIIKEMKGS